MREKSGLMASVAIDLIFLMIWWGAETFSHWATSGVGPFPWLPALGVALAYLLSFGWQKCGVICFGMILSSHFIWGQSWFNLAIPLTLMVSFGFLVTFVGVRKIMMVAPATPRPDLALKVIGLFAGLQLLMGTLIVGFMAVVGAIAPEDFLSLTVQYWLGSTLSILGIGMAFGTVIFPWLGFLMNRLFGGHLDWRRMRWLHLLSSELAWSWRRTLPFFLLIPLMGLILNEVSTDFSLHLWHLMYYPGIILALLGGFQSAILAAAMSSVVVALTLRSTDGLVSALEIQLFLLLLTGTLGLLGTFITERAKDYLILTRAKEVLQRSNFTKARFLLALNESMRRPLTEILTELEKMNSEREVIAAGHQCLALVDSLIGIANLESDLIKPEGRVNLRSLISSAAGSLADGPKVDIQKRLPLTLCFREEAFRSLLEQLFIFAARVNKPSQIPWNLKVRYKNNTLILRVHFKEVAEVIRTWDRLSALPPAGYRLALFLMGYMAKVLRGSLRLQPGYLTRKMDVVLAIPCSPAGEDWV